jgi:translation initiation factor 4E
LNDSFLFETPLFFIFQLMALIGEQFEEGEEICGVVASVRQRQDKLALWTKTASNEAVQVVFSNLLYLPVCLSHA